MGDALGDFRGGVQSYLVYLYKLVTFTLKNEKVKPIETNSWQLPNPVDSLSLLLVESLLQQGASLTVILSFSGAHSRSSFLSPLCLSRRK